MEIDWMGIAAIFIPTIATVIIGYWQIKTMRDLANQTPNHQEAEKVITSKTKDILVNASLYYHYMQ